MPPIERRLAHGRHPWAAAAQRQHLGQRERDTHTSTQQLKKELGRANALGAARTSTTEAGIPKSFGQHALWDLNMSMRRRKGLCVPTMAIESTRNFSVKPKGDILFLRVEKILLQFIIL